MRVYLFLDAVPVVFISEPFFRFGRDPGRLNGNWRFVVLFILNAFCAYYEFLIWYLDSVLISVSLFAGLICTQI